MKHRAFRGTVNGKDAVIYPERKTYIPVGEHRQVAETIDGQMFVLSRHANDHPNELLLFASDQVGIEVSDRRLSP